MKLKIYKDDFLQEVAEERTVEALKIPYRTADAVLDVLAGIDFENVSEYKIVSLVLKNKHHVTTVVRSTFNLTEEELQRVNIVEMLDLAKAIIHYVMQQVALLSNGETDPNAQTQAQTTV